MGQGQHYLDFDVRGRKRKKPNGMTCNAFVADIIVRVNGQVTKYKIVEITKYLLSCLYCVEAHICSVPIQSPACYYQFRGFIRVSSTEGR